MATCQGLAKTALPVPDSRPPNQRMQNPCHETMIQKSEVSDFKEPNLNFPL
jgi:hypothetical protein